MVGDRLPSRHDVFLMFALCVLPVHAWAIFAFLIQVPRLLMRMTISELLAAGAYSLCFALWESLFLMCVLTLAAMLLPARFLRDDLVVKGTGVLYASLPWVFLLLLESERAYAFLFPLAGLLLSLRLVYKLLRDSSRTVALLRALGERLPVLSYSYVAMDMLALFVVVARNV